MSEVELNVTATSGTAGSWWEPRRKYCLYMAACALALFLVASAVQYDLALVVRITAGALTVVAFVALSIEERHVIRSTGGRVTWGYYVVGLAAALAIAVASMWSGAMQRLGFVALGFVLYFLVRSADGLRRAIAGRSRALHAIPKCSIGCMVIAAFWPLPLLVQVGFAALSLVLGAIAVEAWSAAFPSKHATKVSRRIRYTILGGGAGVLLAVLVVLSWRGVDVWTTIWVVLGLGLVAALLATSNDTAYLVAALLVAAVWAGAPRSVPATLGASPAGGVHEPYFAVLGDSFISGEGADRFIAGTNTTNDDPEDGGTQCRRAPTAWTMLLNPPGEFGPGAAMGIPQRVLFLACSGALMADIHPAADSRDEPEQLAALEAAIAEREAADSANARPRFVVIGVGGNDAQFSKVGLVCIAPGDCTEFVDDIRGDYLADVQIGLERTYLAVRTAVGQDVPVIAVPYPIPVNPDGLCRGVLLSDGDIEAVNAFAQELDATIADAATATGVLYLAPVETALADAAAQLCDPQRQAGLNFADLNPKEGGLWSALHPGNWIHNFIHPNERGHSVIAAAALRWFSSEGSCAVAGACSRVALTDDQLARADDSVDQFADAEILDPLDVRIGENLWFALLVVAALVFGWWCVITATFQWRNLPGSTRELSVAERLAMQLLPGTGAAGVE